MAAGQKKPGKSRLGKGLSRKEQVDAHEHELAARLDGQRQPGSGVLPHRKGDVTTERFLFESKETWTRTLLLSTRDITKIVREAAEAGKEPGLLLTVHTVPRTTPSEWVAVSLDVFVELLGETR